MPFSRALRLALMITIGSAPKICVAGADAAASRSPAGGAAGIELVNTAGYFGAKLPGDNAEVFAPGIVSKSGRFEARLAFSPDLRECFLTETDATFSKPKLLVATREREHWSDFVPVPFGSTFNVCHEPFVSNDNKKLYFTADGDADVSTNKRDFWVTQRTPSGWSKPAKLPDPINSNFAEFFFSQSAEGTIVFASNRPGGKGDFDLYYVDSTGEGALTAKNLGPEINTPGPEYDPCISTNGRYLVFASARHGRPHLDLYVSYRKLAANGKGATWSEPEPLDGSVNTPANEYAPTLSPDGRYLFFVRHDGKQSDVYWMSTAQFLRKHRGD